MKKIFLLSGLLLSGCTVSDTYWKPDVGPNNVGTVDAIREIQPSTDNELHVGREERFSNFCPYLFGVFKLDNDCSPDKIASTYNLQTITEVNTQMQIFPFVLIQRTTLIGIPKSKE